jgi:predicted  nucleic acid-binding Zn-ribbon protein
MTTTTGALRTLHRLHRQLNDLRERLNRGPKQIRARERNAQQLEETLAKVQDEAQQARMTADRKQLDLKANEDKILDWKARLNSCSSNKEYQALLEQIAAAEMAGSVLSDEILEGLEKIDELEEKIRTGKEQVAAAHEQLSVAKQQVSDGAAAIRSDLARLEGELNAAEANLPPDFRADYDRVIRARSTDGLAQVDNSYCGGCYQHITANMDNDLALGRAVFCNACGRLLYPSESEQEGRTS